MLSVEDGELRYYEHRFPLSPGSWSAGEDPETELRQVCRRFAANVREAELNLSYTKVVAPISGTITPEVS